MSNGSRDAAKPALVAVGIATRNRPEGLRRLLASLSRMEVPGNTTLMPVVVVNGDEQLPTVEGEAIVVREPQLGIPQARNRAIEVARDIDADFLAFVDDDEVVEPDWLVELLAGLRRHEADAATGPVISRLPPSTPRHVANHPIFAAVVRPTGSAVRDAYTGNLLVSAAVLARSDFRFDERLALTGGEDTELSRRLSGQGVRFVWIQNAVVIEDVPPIRANVRWLLRRSIQIGANRVQRLRLSGDSPSWFVCLAGSVLEVAIGLVGCLSWPVSRSTGLRLVGRGARGVGVLLALTGHNPHPYRSVDSALPRLHDGQGDWQTK